MSPTSLLIYTCIFLSSGKCISKKHIRITLLQSTSFSLYSNNVSPDSQLQWIYRAPSISKNHEYSNQIPNKRNLSIDMLMMYLNSWRFVLYDLHCSITELENGTWNEPWSLKRSSIDGRTEIGSIKVVILNHAFQISIVKRRNLKIIFNDKGEFVI